PHRVEGKKVRIEEHAFPLCRTLGILRGKELTTEKLEKEEEEEVMPFLEKVAGFPVRKKAPTWIGSKMGRPEKAKPREMDPPPHLLFPVGQAGGPTRSILKAAKSEELRVEIANLKCPSCGTLGISRKCPSCGAKTEFVKLCPKCGRPTKGRCQTCGVREEFFSERMIDLKKMLEEAEKRLGEKAPEDLKGVRGMSSAYKIPEPLEKGILRAKYDLRVFKDGTVRFDATNLPLTHFCPREVGVPVERLRELGYTRDYLGEPLEREDQLVELKVQDLILCEEGAKYLLRASKFIDELLQKFYGLPPYYRAQRKEDLLGHLVVGLSPHTSVGMVGRIVGFTKANVGYAHPYFHAAKRRDCDGDEDAVMLLLDALLNFSRRFLPASRGGFMDAPLVLNLRIDPKEVDKEVHNMDTMFKYPLEFYEATLKQAHPTEVLVWMETVEKRLGTEGQYEGLGFNVHTSDLAKGPLTSTYSELETMEEKVMAQLSLARRIRAVDERDVAERVIEHHLIPDLKGNLRKFSTQQFRCTSCNTKYRRIPLVGMCIECGGNLVLTVPRGGVEKYLRTALRIAEEFGVSEYTKQRLKLMESDIKSVFESDAERQMSLADFL
ncbi:MAG: DNA polymerase II large subunit, partial [Candidatus Hadarchaeales archaeon]